MILSAMVHGPKESVWMIEISTQEKPDTVSIYTPQAPEGLLSN